MSAKKPIPATTLVQKPFSVSKQTSHCKKNPPCGILLIDQEKQSPKTKEDDPWYDMRACSVN